MGGQFAWSAAEMTAEIKRMGPNPLRPDEKQEELPETGSLTMAQD